DADGILEWSGSDDGAFRDRTPDRLGLGGPVQDRRAKSDRSSGISADRQRALLQHPAADADATDAGHARSGDLATGLEYVVSVVAGIHALEPGPDEIRNGLQFLNLTHS